MAKYGRVFNGIMHSLFTKAKGGDPKVSDQWETFLRSMKILAKCLLKSKVPLPYGVLNIISKAQKFE